MDRTGEKNKSGKVKIKECLDVAFLLGLESEGVRDGRRR